MSSKSVEHRIEDLEKAVDQVRQTIEFLGNRLGNMERATVKEEPEKVTYPPAPHEPAWDGAVVYWESQVGPDTLHRAAVRQDGTWHTTTGDSHLTWEALVSRVRAARTVSRFVLCTPNNTLLGGRHGR